MSQKQFTTFEANILSFEIREAMLGVLRPGRFSGFDSVVAGSTTPTSSYFYATIGHTNGVQKLASDAVALSAAIGVAVTTQGTVIHEDQLIENLAIPNNAAGTGNTWSIIYMEHDYESATSGDNPATYGVFTGTINVDSIPTLGEAYHRIPLFYVRVTPVAIWEDIEFFIADSAKGFGDTNWVSKLFGTGSPYLEKWYDDTLEDTVNIGTVPADGVLGNRNFDTQNYVTDYQSLTDAISALDTAIASNHGEIGTNSADIITLGNRRIDDVDWGNLNATSSTVNDVTVTHHGLVPLPPGLPSRFLNGLGAWSVPTGARIVMRTGSFSTDVIRYTPYDNTGVEELDLSGIVPADCDMVFIKCYAYGDIPNNSFIGINFRAYAAGSNAGTIYLKNQTGATLLMTVHGTVAMTLDANKKIYIQQSTTYMNDTTSIHITVTGWQTYS